MYERCYDSGDADIIEHYCRTFATNPWFLLISYLQDIIASRDSRFLIIPYHDDKVQGGVQVDNNSHMR